MASSLWTPPPPTGPSPEPTLEETRRSPWRLLSRVVIVVLILGIAIMWIFALFGDHPVPGRFTDTTFPQAAEPICKAANDRVATLPRAFESPTAAARADVVDQATVHIETMVRELRVANAPTLPYTARIGEWLTDWDRYIADRRDYSRRLRSITSATGQSDEGGLGADAKFLLTQSDRDKAQITRAMDNFATVNNMPACKVPEDVV